MAKLPARILSGQKGIANAKYDLIVCDPCDHMRRTRE